VFLCRDKDAGVGIEGKERDRPRDMDTDTCIGEKGEWCNVMVCEELN